MYEHATPYFVTFDEYQDVTRQLHRQGIKGGDHVILHAEHVILQADHVIMQLQADQCTRSCGATTTTRFCASCLCYVYSIVIKKFLIFFRHPDENQVNRIHYNINKIILKWLIVNAQIPQV